MQSSSFSDWTFTTQAQQVQHFQGVLVWIKLKLVVFGLISSRDKALDRVNVMCTIPTMSKGGWKCPFYCCAILPPILLNHNLSRDQFAYDVHWMP